MIQLKISWVSKFHPKIVSNVELALHSIAFLARLDGTNKPMKHATFEDYLQMDGWEPPPMSKNGKKRVLMFNLCFEFPF